MSLLAITFISDTRLYKRILHWLGRAVCIVLILTSLYLPTGSDAIAGTTRADKALLSMQKAYARNNTKQLNALLPRVKGHPLESLAAYWTRKSNLANATPQDMATFFARWQGTYWEDRLRNDWMLLLIKRQDWETLLRVHPRFRMQDDPQVECGVWRAQRASGRAAQGVSDKRMVDLWFQESSGHTACLGAVSDLVADKKVSNDTLWMRARQGAEWGSRSTMLGALALIDKRSGANGKTLYKQPYTWLLKNMPSLARNRTQAGKNKTSAWLSLGLIRMAAHNNKAFDKAFKRWKKHLRPEQQQAVQAVVATRMALRGNAAAHDLFLNIAPARLNDRQREWQVRAALRAGDWSAVLASIDAMPSTQKSDSRWQFWRARAMQASTKQGQRARATAVLTQLATSDDFYGLLAKQTLGQAIRRPVDGPRPTAAAVKRVAADPNIKAARSAYALGLTKEAARQWTYAVALHQPGGMAQADLAAAGAIACGMQWWSRCIQAGERMPTGAPLAYTHPTPYARNISQQAQSLDLDPALIYGVIRQESRFDAQIKSSAGAIGLMQVMPKTGRWVAKRMNIKRFKTRQLETPDVNLQLGSNYLHTLLTKYSASVPMATAAYNAGPSRVAQWRPKANEPAMEAAIWMELIPFSETRNYVQKVIANQAIYRTMQAQSPYDLGALLRPVAPAGDKVGEDDVP